MSNELVRPELPRVNENDLKFVRMSRHNGAIYHKEGEPFTGFVVFDRHKNGNIQSEAEHVNGEQVGWEVSYHENGKVSYQVLMYGATSIVFHEYDKAGNEVNGGFVSSAAIYNKCAQITGMELMDEE